MAMTAESLRGPLFFSIDLKSGLTQQPIHAQLMKGDKRANTIIVALTENKKPVNLTDVTVTGSFISPIDKAEIALEGSINGNEASVTLIDECYAAEGYFEANVKLTVGETSRTILSITGYVLSKGSGAVIDIGNVIPSIDDIIAQYETMKRVTKDTQEAAEAANAAAKNAPYIDASNNHWMAWDADASEYVDTGVTATGPKGADGTNGQTPYIGENGNWWIGDSDTGTKAQGPAGANGTGSGTVTAVTVNGTKYEPDDTGDVNLGELGGGSGVPDGGTTGQTLVKQSETNGDATWKTLTYEDVGALASDGTAEDASKLGGVEASEYAKLTDIPTDTGSLSMDLLWSNASSTSAFAGQSLEVDTTGYEYMLVLYRMSTTSGRIQMPAVTIANGSTNVEARVVAPPAMYLRTVNSGGGKVTFGDTSKFASVTSTTTSTDNNFLIPIRIFGIKGVG